MINQSSIYKRVTAKDHNEYICPMSVAQGDMPLEMDQLDDCVEADVVGRYIGNLNIIEGD